MILLLVASIFGRRATRRAMMSINDALDLIGP